MPDPKAGERDVDDTTGRIFVFAGYLKPGRHQIIIRDSNDTFWGKNIVVDHHKGEILQGK
jgi:hypothetical protein